MLNKGEQLNTRFTNTSAIENKRHDLISQGTEER